MLFSDPFDTPHLLSLHAHPCFPLTALPTEVFKHIALEVALDPVALPSVLPYASLHFSAPVAQFLTSIPMTCCAFPHTIPLPPFLLRI
jgi:hypothetical protein